MTEWDGNYAVFDMNPELETVFKHPTGGQCAHCGKLIVPGADTWPADHHVFCKLACRASWLKWGRYL